MALPPKHSSSPSSSRAKARRERFALTRTLSEQQYWGYGGLCDLPSPTIGPGPSSPPGLLLLQGPPTSNVSPLALFNSTGPRARVFQTASSTTSNKLLWRTQHRSPAAKPVRAQTRMRQWSRTLPHNSLPFPFLFFQLWREEPQGPPQPAGTTTKPNLLLRLVSRPWKSFDWGDVSRWRNPPWTPFLSPQEVRGRGKRPSPPSRLDLFQLQTQRREVGGVGGACETCSKERGEQAKSSTLPALDSRHLFALRNAEKRRRFFAKKQNNSAPDRFSSWGLEGGFTQNVLTTTSRWLVALMVHDRLRLILFSLCPLFSVSPSRLYLRGGSRGAAREETRRKQEQSLYLC